MRRGAAVLVLAATICALLPGIAHADALPAAGCPRLEDVFAPNMVLIS